MIIPTRRQTREGQKGVGGHGQSSVLEIKEWGATGVGGGGEWK